jgi:hypothetical protein
VIALFLILRQNYAVRELVDLECKLTTKEKELLKNSLDDIIAENPKTELDTIKFKHPLAKVAQESKDIASYCGRCCMRDSLKKFLLGKMPKQLKRMDCTIEQERRARLADDGLW